MGEKNAGTSFSPGRLPLAALVPDFRHLRSARTHMAGFWHRYAHLAGFWHQNTHMAGFWHQGSGTRAGEKD